MPSPAETPPHLLIIGGGITGLLLAQALRKRHSLTPNSTTPTFTIYERDPNPEFRGAGWGLTIHWALSDFTSLLPEYLVERIPETYVDRGAVESGEKGNFLMFDLSDGKEKFRVPPAERIRVSRERLRALLMDGLDIKWSKTLTTLTKSQDSSESPKIIALFTDGTQETGDLVTGADGSRSQVRKILCQDNHENGSLPVRLLGVSVLYPRSRCEEIRALDPYFFQATDPKSNAFLYFSFLNVPIAETTLSEDKTDEAGKDDVICQIIISWPYREGFLGKEEPTEVPASTIDRVKLMKEISEPWIQPFRGIVHDIPEDTDVKTIALEDWVPSVGGWENAEFDGRVTLVGDAAHAMTMYRGEAANHGIKDVATFFSELCDDQNRDIKTAIQKYEEQMRPRARTAVLTSRRACLDAHEPGKINEKSPLVARRVMVFED